MNISMCFILLVATCVAQLYRQRIVAFSWQEWLRKLTKILRHTYIAHIVLIILSSGFNNI